MWMALLEKDMEKLKKLSTYFNVEDFYGLFACIVTGRSWDAINKGINNTDFTQSEVQ
jgi:aarF domain-containing kinase